MKSQPPTCRHCKTETIVADAGIFKAILYFYCRKCKAEVDRYGYFAHVEKKDALKDLENYMDEVIPTETQLELEMELDSYPYNPFKYKASDDQDQDLGSLSSRFAP